MWLCHVYAIPANHSSRRSACVCVCVCIFFSSKGHHLSFFRKYIRKDIRKKDPIRTSEHLKKKYSVKIPRLGSPSRLYDYIPISAMAYELSTTEAACKLMINKG